MSDRTIDLPNKYYFEREGGYSNIVTRNHKFIIDHAALDYSYNEKYLMFVYDTVRIIPEKIITTKLFFLVVDIKNDTISQRMNYLQYKEFIKKKGINKKLDLSFKNF
jgi:hypothetical protein